MRATVGSAAADEPAASRPAPSAAATTAETAADLGTGIKELRKMRESVHVRVRCCSGVQQVLRASISWLTGAVVKGRRVAGI
ncbi:hypothetical protein GCM10010278_20150 [Streptomyces melanogenes]|nr:hypothetical protein GCM10010278_20150 [Streptomyces melanogenes]